MTDPTPERKNSISKPLIAFVALYMIVCSGLALKQGNTEFLMYAVVMLVFIAIVHALHRAIHFTPTALWLLAIWGFLHMCGGTVPVDPSLTDAYRAASAEADRPTSAVLYSLRIHPDFPKYDQIVHTFGFFSATIACFQALVTLLNAPRAVPTAIAAALMGIGLGAINEVIEFIAVLSMPETNVGGYMNTAWDLVANTIGATCAGYLSLLLYKNDDFQEDA
tara:strand:+ start:177421 stop:178083 length:663 start_codon:yes stop_codon:yes gene_type:complete